MNILVCGGAGYIGSHAVLALIEQGYDVFVIDNLSKGHEKAVSKDARLFVGDIRDSHFLHNFFTDNKIDAVIDFAAYSLVGESVTKPYEYFENNTAGTLSLLNAMKNNDVSQIVFSSTAAVYGEPAHIPILEDDQTSPENPYGESKLMVEKILKWFDAAYGMRYAVLRYFNVAGAHIGGHCGEDHTPETHLIPNVLKAAQGEIDKISIFGDDYPTEDGTCIRDYIHVTDLCAAHILALTQIAKENKSVTYNLGSQKGFSVKEIIEAAQRVTGKKIPVTVVKRRPGDPARLVASSDKITKELGVTPAYESIEQIIETAWVWHTNHPKGYASF